MPNTSSAKAQMASAVSTAAATAISRAFRRPLARSRAVVVASGSVQVDITYLRVRHESRARRVAAGVRGRTLHAALPRTFHVPLLPLSCAAAPCYTVYAHTEQCIY